MLTVTELLRLTSTIYRRNAGLYLGYAGWLMIPSSAVAIAAAVVHPEQSWILDLGQVVIFLMTLGVWILLTRITGNIVAQQKINLDELSRKTMELLWPVFWVGLAVTVIQVVGFVLLIIPGVLFLVWYGFAEMEVVINEQRGLTALRESRALSRGRFFPVLWRLLLGPLVLLAVYVSLSAGLISLVELIATGSVTFFTGAPSLAANLIQTITDVFALPIFVIYPAVLYLDLKQSLEKQTP